MSLTMFYDLLLASGETLYMVIASTIFAIVAGPAFGNPAFY